MPGFVRTEGEGPAPEIILYECLTDMSYFPFYRYAMTFEEFVPAFSSWFAGNRCGVAILTGVRADESLNRFMGLVSQRKLRYADDKPWTTASPEGFYYTLYPLYDGKPVIYGYITPEPELSTIPCMT